MAIPLDDVRSRVLCIVCDIMHEKQGDIKDDTRFIQDLNADSLDGVEMAMEIEDEFEVFIEDDQYTQVKTFKDAVDLVERVVKT